MSSDATIAQLKEQLAHLQHQNDELKMQLEKSNNEKKGKREKIAQMTAEVVDSNPYR